MPRRWAIRVTFADGNEAWLRHGSRIGSGPIATFGSRKLAEINAEFVGHGLDAGAVVTIIEHHKLKSVAPTEGK